MITSETLMKMSDEFSKIVELIGNFHAKIDELPICDGAKEYITVQFAENMIEKIFHGDA